MIESYRGRYGVIGPPGTGKTTFLAGQVRTIVEKIGERSDGGSPVLVSSLTRTAAAEIAGRDLPVPREAVGTLHSHAFRALDRPTIATGEVLASWNEANPGFEFAEGARKADADDLTVEDLGGGMATRGDEIRAAYDLCRHRMTPAEVYSNPDFSLGEVTGTDLGAFAERYEEWKTSAGVFDFTDLISGALAVEPPLDPDVIVVDEVQDLSALEWSLVQTWTGDRRALIAVGDPWQSLYTWRGAHPELFQTIEPGRLRTLSQSYRVPRVVVATALEWMRGKIAVASDLVYRPRKDAEGEIRFRREWTPTAFDSMLAEVEDRVAEGRSVMLAASCGYMLNPIIVALRSRGIPFSNPWRTKRGDWNPINTRGTTALDRMTAFLTPATRGRLWTWEEVAAWLPNLKTKDVLAHGAKTSVEDKAKRLPDDVATSIEISALVRDSSLFSLVESIRGKGQTPEVVEAAFSWLRPRLVDAGARSIDFARMILGGRHAKDAAKPRVYVGTVHSFKGAEADDVFLFTELPPKAREAFDAMRLDEIESVARMFYVGMTRARETLTVCGTSSSAERNSRPMIQYLEHAARVAGVA